MPQQCLWWMNSVEYRGGFVILSTGNRLQADSVYFTARSMGWFEIKKVRKHKRKVVLFRFFRGFTNR